MVDIIIQIPVLLLSVIVHEIAHGYAALKLGDGTAKEMNRLTLNPIPHIDLVWSIIIPGILILSQSQFLIGGAKPVPIDPRNFKDPRKGMMIVSVAGPLSNFILAIISSILFKILNGMEPSYGSYGFITLKLLLYACVINIVLGVFNLIPIPPLDGSKILLGLLPPRMAYAYSMIEQYGFIIIILLLFTNMLPRILGFFCNPLLKLLLG